MNPAYIHLLPAQSENTFTVLGGQVNPADPWLPLRMIMHSE